jgi:hypothetical protein
VAVFGGWVNLPLLPAGGHIRAIVFGGTNQSSVEANEKTLREPATVPDGTNEIQKRRLPRLRVVVGQLEGNRNNRYFNEE